MTVLAIRWTFSLSWPTFISNLNLADLFEQDSLQYTMYKSSQAKENFFWIYQKLSSPEVIKQLCLKLFMDVLCKYEE